MNAVDTRRLAHTHEADPPICLVCPDCHGRGALAAPRRGALAALHRWVLGRPWMDAHALPCPTCRGDGCVERRLGSQGEPAGSTLERPQAARATDPPRRSDRSRPTAAGSPGRSPRP